MVCVHHVLGLDLLTAGLSERLEATIDRVRSTRLGRALLASTLVVALLVSGCSAAGPRDPSATPTVVATAAPAADDRTTTPTTTPVPGLTTPPSRPTVAPRFVVEHPDRRWHITTDASPAFGISPGTRAPAPVEGYADQSSVTGGHRVQLFVSTSASRWRATAYRMGWYGGEQGARVWQSSWHKGRRQARAADRGLDAHPGGELATGRSRSPQRAGGPAAT